MATAPYTTVDQATGIAEDVQDEIYIISPVDNPIASMSRTIRAKSTTHEWLEDELTPAGRNVHQEGADATMDDGRTPVRLSAPTQIMSKTAQVTGSLEEVDKYGRDSEMAYQLEIKYGELANDEEVAIAGMPTSGTRQTGATGLTRELPSFYSQLDAGNLFDASVGPITTYAQLEGLLLDAHEKAYMSGSNPTYMITSPAGSRHISNLVLAAGRARDIRNERRLVNVIDLYVSNYGELDVVLDRHMRDVTGAATFNQLYEYNLIDFNYLATPVLRATRDWPIAKTGDSDKRQILRESTLAVLNQKAHAIVHSVPATLTV